MRWLAILSLTYGSLALADEPLPPDLRAEEKNLPIVRIQSPQPVELEFLRDSQDIEVASIGLPLISISSETWRTACESPCNARQYRRAIFRISGDGIMTSEAFTLPRKGHRITLEVSPGSLAVRRAGWATLSVGLTMFLIGGVAVGVSPVNGPVNGQNPVFLGGLVPASLGLSLIITGIPLLAKSRTLVTTDTE